MDEEFLNKRIQEALENMPENFNILEEQIDVQLQMDYFNYTSKLREQGAIHPGKRQKEKLFVRDFPITKKKKILAALASSGKVDAFRTIEKYLEDPDAELKDWAILALQEARMLLQSIFLDEQQVFISTGLGGKGRKLRYFVVFINKTGSHLTEMQKNLLRDELKYVIGRNEGEVEEFSEMLDFNTAQVVLPLKAPLKDIFRGIIDECNQYGDFLKEDMVITNVKRLNTVEIIDFLNQQKTLEKEDSEAFDPEEEE